MTKLVLDTEFTALEQDAKLISLALVNPATGQYLYLELNEGWAPEDCSEFVCEHVLPKLDLQKHGVGLAEAKNRVVDFIREQGQDVRLMSDGLAWDYQMLRSLLDTDEQGRVGLTERLVPYLGMIDLSMLTAADGESSLQHSALRDALLLAEKFNAFVVKNADKKWVFA